MPLYDYACEACGHRFEVTLKLDQLKQRVLCALCGDVAHRRPSAPAFHLKGQSGWYKGEPKPKSERA